MNKLLVVTVLVALLALSAESFRVPREAQEEQQQGTLTTIADKVRGLYESTVSTASGYLESVKGLKLEEKAKNLYTDTSAVVGTYGGILQDQIYHLFYPQQ
ncbi:apolipoprotein C-II [Seriola aureovittata]|uniref:apolipoprotein C-II n=1 Tax=Seriola aureovittata TaxID=2871759 RepID=UPI0024BD750C|nr:apolipoprotein C-II [Seriola aureovittata]